MGTPEPAYHPALSNINTSNCTHTSTRSKLIHYSAASSTTMEASQHNTLQIIQNYVKTPSIEVVPPKTIKMEDITSTTTSSSLLDVPSLDCASRGAESKPTKKRKSWGQQLPEPKTNLPPRKRAKTEDEKEQRRVERVLRNRRAAQSSRERKRQEVEALEAQKLAVEQTNQDLIRRLADAEAKNALLERQLEQMSGGMSAFNSSSVASSPGASEQLRQTPRPSITFSQNLFGPRDA